MTQRRNIHSAIVPPCPLSATHWLTCCSVQIREAKKTFTNVIYGKQIPTGAAGCLIDGSSAGFFAAQITSWVNCAGKLSSEWAQAAAAAQFQAIDRVPDSRSYGDGAVSEVRS